MELIQTERRVKVEVNMSDSILYSKHDAKRINNLLWSQVIFMKVCGLMNPKFESILPLNWSTFGKVASKVFNGLVISSALHLAILFAKTAFDFFQHGALEDITDALTMLIIYAFAAFSGIYWNVRSEELERFISSLNRGYEHHSLAGLTFVNSRPSYDFARRLTRVWLSSCGCGVMFWALTPIILGQRVLPIKCWYPFDTKEPGTYEILYCIQIIAQILMGGAFGNGSSVYVAVIVIMLGQFDVLFCSLKNVQAHAELLAGERFSNFRKLQTDEELKHDELNQYITCTEHKVDLNIYTAATRQPTSANLELALKYSMKRCIIHHQFILRSCKELERLFNPYCLVKSLQITMQLCLLVFIGVVGETTIIRSMNVVGYLILTLVELLMFTYYGELLRSHSLRAGEALLRSPWQRNTVLFKKEILIFLINTKKPVQLTAGKFFVMDVERLRSVVTQAFSFLTLLQKIAAKKP